MRGLAWAAIVAAALGIAGLVLGIVGYWERDGYLLGVAGIVMLFALVFATLSLRE